MLEQLDVVAILSTGVSGFAFLMLFIGYRLTDSVQKRIAEVDLTQLTSEKLETWKGISEKQLANTRYFILFSLTFFFGGLLLLYLQHRPVASINVMVYPSDPELLPALIAQNTQVFIDEFGNGSAKVKSEHTLTVNNTKMHKALMEVMKQLAAAQVSERDLSARLVANAPDAGFGTLFGEE